MIYEKTINLLGKKCKDIITGSTGIVTSVSFDLYGCIQVIIDPQKVTKEGQAQKAIGWIDVNRVKVVANKKIMKCPDFVNKYPKFEKVQGAACKPIK